MLHPKLVLILKDVLSEFSVSATSSPVLKRHGIFYTYVILEVTENEPLYNTDIHRILSYTKLVKDFMYINHIQLHAFNSGVYKTTHEHTHTHIHTRTQAYIFEGNYINDWNFLKLKAK